MDTTPTPIGMRERGGYPELFGISPRDRLQHLHLLGKSGSGKTTLMRNLLIGDVEAGRGVAFVDPHGDEAERLLDEIPASRTDGFVYFDAADQAHPVGLNLLEAVAPSRRALMTASVVAAFKALWSESWGPRLEYILANAVAALLEVPPEKGGATLLGVPRLLIDEAYRVWVLAQVRDPRVLSFWQGEYEGWGARLQAEATAPVLNKAGRLLLSPMLRNILGQVKSTIKPRTIMDQGQVLICNLAKGKLGEGDSNLLGSLLITKFQLDAMARADVPEEERKPFYLYVDEFQNFTTEGFCTALSELRKYGLGLVLSHQFTAQLTPNIYAAVRGNVGSTISFRLGAEDAELLCKELAPFPPERLCELGRGEVCARLLRNGEPGDPFMGRTLPPLRRGYDRRETLLGQSRQRYGTSRERVEGRLARWFAR